ncbi:MAG: GT4 family glycosyltransferase PelF [Candidatus Methylomirabilales bacterium]
MIDRFEKIRICRVITRLNIGGPGQQCILLTAGLNRERFETLLISGQETDAEGSLRGLAAQRGVEPSFIQELGRPVQIGADLVALGKLCRLFRKIRPRIVHTHTAKAGTLGRIAAWLTGVPATVHTFHGHVFQGYFSPAMARLFLGIERNLARRTSRIVALSEGQRQELLALGIGNPDRTMVIPPGLELAPFLHCQEERGQLRRELKLPPDAPLVGIVSRLVPIKGHRTFLRAARLVVAALPSAHFLVVGDGKLRPELEADARTLGLQEQVRFLGWRLDLSRIYADLDCLALSSRNEGVPVCLLEAMTAGVPVVATAVGGVPDLVIPGVTGLLVQPEDPQDLAAAILNILRNPALARRMTVAARHRVYPRYDLGSLLTATEKLYEELLAAPAGEVGR